MSRLLRTLGALAGTALLVTGGAGVAGATSTGSTDGDGMISPAQATAVAKSSSSMSTLASPPSGCRPLLIWAYAQTCFEYDGDDQWVKDTDANGWQAVVHTHTSYGKDRYCAAPAAADGWGQCNYDHDEDMCVKWRVYEQKDGQIRNTTAWSAWYWVADGTLCE